VNLTASASGPHAISFVEYIFSGRGRDVLGSSKIGPSYDVSLTVDDMAAILTCGVFTGLLHAEATDVCGNVGASPGDTYTFDTTGAAACSLAVRQQSLNWTSALEVPDGEGQVVVNGRSASAVRTGLAAIAAEGRKGSNRVEAQLVRGGGRPGTWRFQFSGQSGLKAGSLRAVAGTVLVITGDAVVFRLQGKPGERLVFMFEVE
jgi:hypothetical protein